MKKKKKNLKIKEKNLVRLTPQEQKEREAVLKWEPSHNMGQIKYILLKGTLAWSVLTGGIFILLTLISNGFTADQALLLYFLKMIVAFIGLGTVFGMITWHFSEKKYQAYMDAHPPVEK